MRVINTSQNDLYVHVCFSLFFLRRGEFEFVLVVLVWACFHLGSAKGWFCSTSAAQRNKNMKGDCSHI